MMNSRLATQTRPCFNQPNMLPGTSPPQATGTANISQVRQITLGQFNLMQNKKRQMNSEERGVASVQQSIAQSQMKLQQQFRPRLTSECLSGPSTSSRAELLRSGTSRPERLPTANGVSSDEDIEVVNEVNVGLAQQIPRYISISRQKLKECGINEEQCRKEVRSKGGVDHHVLRLPHNDVNTRRLLDAVHNGGGKSSSTMPQPHHRIIHQVPQNPTQSQRLGSGQLNPARFPVQGGSVRFNQTTVNVRPPPATARLNNGFNKPLHDVVGYTAVHRNINTPQQQRAMPAPAITSTRGRHFHQVATLRQPTNVAFVNGQGRPQFGASAGMNGTRICETVPGPLDRMGQIRLKPASQPIQRQRPMMLNPISNHQQHRVMQPGPAFIHSNRFRPAPSIPIQPAKQLQIAPVERIENRPASPMVTEPLGIALYARSRNFSGSQKGSVYTSGFTCDWFDHDEDEYCKSRLSTNLALISHVLAHFINQHTARTFEITGSDNRLVGNCNICYRKYPSLFALQQHVNNVHRVDNGFCCLICDGGLESRFSSMELLSAHCRSKHRTFEMPYACLVPQCGFRSSLYDDVIFHFQSVHYDTRFLQCPLCLRVFDGGALGGTSSPDDEALPAKAFASHVAGHLRHNHKCQACRLFFMDTKDLIWHQGYGHGSISGGVLTQFKQITMEGCIPVAQRKPGIVRSRRPIEPVHNPMSIGKSVCIECLHSATETPHSTSSIALKTQEHYSDQNAVCSKCNFTSNCARTYARHCAVHDSVNGTISDNFVKREVVNDPLYGCFCGFKTPYGNLLASHIAQCAESFGLGQPVSLLDTSSDDRIYVPPNILRALNLRIKGARFPQEEDVEVVECCSRVDTTDEELSEVDESLESPSIRPRPLLLSPRCSNASNSSSVKLPQAEYVGGVIDMDESSGHESENSSKPRTAIRKCRFGALEKFDDKLINDIASTSKTKDNHHTKRILQRIERAQGPCRRRSVLRPGDLILRRDDITTDGIKDHMRAIEVNGVVRGLVNFVADNVQYSFNSDESTNDLWYADDEEESSTDGEYENEKYQSDLDFPEPILQRLRKRKAKSPLHESSDDSVTVIEESMTEAESRYSITQLLTVVPPPVKKISLSGSRSSNTLQQAYGDLQDKGLQSGQQNYTYVNTTRHAISVTVRPTGFLPQLTPAPDQHHVMLPTVEASGNECYSDDSDVIILDDDDDEPVRNNNEFAKSILPTSIGVYNAHNNITHHR